MARTTARSQSHTGFYLLLFVALGLMLFTVLPLLQVFLMAFIVSVVTAPLYDRLARATGRPALSSALCVAILLVGVIIPLYGFVALALGQVTTLAPVVQSYVSMHSTETIVRGLPFGELLTPDSDTAAFAKSSVGAVMQYIQSLLVPLAATTLSATIQLVLFVFTLLFMYPSKDALLAYIKDIVPLADDESAEFVDDLVASAKTTIQSSFAAAFAQALASFVAYIVIGVPAPAFWFFAVFLVSLLPLGSGIINVPIALALLITGRPVEALLLLAWQILVVSNVDNVVRMAMLRRNAVQLPALLTLAAILGGLATFGFLGIIYGPLIAVMFVFMLELYKKKRG